MSVIVNSLPKGTILHGKSYNYIIRETLGQGSFGITYLASVKLEGRLGTLESQAYVCVKEFFMKDRNGRKEDSVTCEGDTTLFDKYRKDFTREALNLSRVHHPNIVKVLESFECNGTSYYTMEYIDGQSLNDYIISNNGMSEYDALSALRIIASAVECMHQNNMLHLDIKPLNIMRQNDGKLILIDFGLSKQFNKDGEPESSTSIGGGTLGYAPLEQNNYKRGMGFPATLDVYALGATLYKCITGATPPNSSYILNEGLPLEELRNHFVSNETIRIIEKAMSPIVRNRFQTVSQILEHLNSVLPNANHDTISDEALTYVSNSKYQGGRNVQYVNDIPVVWSFDSTENQRKGIKALFSKASKTQSNKITIPVSNEVFCLITELRKPRAEAFATVKEIVDFIIKLNSLTGGHSFRLQTLNEFWNEECTTWESEQNILVTSEDNNIQSMVEALEDKDYTKFKKVCGHKEAVELLPKELKEKLFKFKIVVDTFYFGEFFKQPDWT